MTQEEKQLLLKDLCARLPYGVQCKKFEHDKTIDVTYTSRVSLSNLGLEGFATGKFELKPYLRPMSSMTEEERDEYFDFRNQELQRVAFAEVGRESAIGEISDWLNKKMFDYRGLIPMGLALEAPDDMYKTE